MLLNCYYYAPHNHELLNRHLEWDLNKMREIGCDIVSVCVQSSQLSNWHQRRLKNVVEKAHEFGLKIHAVPNRWLGITAGWLDGYSDYMLKNEDALRKADDGTLFLDFKQKKIREKFMEDLKIMLLEFGFDGIIWDEPRPQTDEVIFFLDEMSEYAKTFNHEISTSLFAMSGGLHLASVFVQTKHIDYLGSDGHVRSESHKMRKMKNTIWKAYETFNPVLTDAGKKTIFLLEGQRHRDEDLNDYLKNINKAFNLPMDHLMFYYSAHEMSWKNEDVFNEATWNAAELAGMSAAVPSAK
jgi:hypothetical protein